MTDVAGKLGTHYSPEDFEKKWYTFWQESGFFHSEPDSRVPYTVVIPPPNVTGILHMGHMLNNTLQDVLVRRARMRGYNACWVPGTDHASIATEAKVVDKLRREGIEKNSLQREEFIEHAWAWTREHGGIILEQLKRLGASCDWARTAFTMDPIRTKSVLHVFVDLYRKGYIYRGVRMVNWDPVACTALSDEEVLHREVEGRLYYLKYRVVGSDEEYIEVATTRPETIMGDVAVCMHPEDTRYAHLHGKQVIVPLVGREVPLIADEYVDKEFGTGLLKITPAHDVNDYAIGERYGLESIDVFDDHAVIAPVAGMYVGLDRFAAREAIVKDLREAGLLSREEPYTHSVGFSERTDAVIEPRMSLQWFLRMTELVKPALLAVEDGSVQLVPSKFEAMYRHWLENIRDWCISRQLWWGHRLPVWYYGSGEDYVVAHDEDEALQLAREATGDSNLSLRDLRQDEDVLDTWFSSWLWPISVFNGILDPENEEIRYYYPTQDLVTAPEIIFFWVARMIIAGYEFRGERPFERVYLTGIVRDLQRRKMSKSLGNSPDPIKLMEKYGADGVRVGMLLCSNAGNDLLFEEELCAQGRNFCNKVWNAYRLVKGWRVDTEQEQGDGERLSISVFVSYLRERLRFVDDQFSQYRISEALKELYRLFWDDFSGWFLEMIKPSYGSSIDGTTYDAVEKIFDILLWYLHPFIPFISEELWHGLGSERETKSLMVSSCFAYPVQDDDGASSYELFKGIVSGVRGVRSAQRVENKTPLNLYYMQEHSLPIGLTEVLCNLAGVARFAPITEREEGLISFHVGSMEFFVEVPFCVDVEQERQRIQEELTYQQGFLCSVKKKLGNERFLKNAPAKVVELERKKEADAQARIASLEEQLAALR